MFARKLLLLVVASTLAIAAPASASQVHRVASGLDNPRHLAFGDDELYVAEAGRGGSGPCFVGPEGPQAPPVCVGASGAVTVIDEHGRQSRLVEGLASFATQGPGSDAIGPHGIYATGEHKLFVTNGGPTAANRDELAAQNPVADLFGRLLQVKRHGRVVSLADIWDFERDNNPDAQVGEKAIDSNPVDVLAQNGRLIVADAGGNTLLKVKRNGSIDVLSLFANRSAPNPFGPGEIPMQTVPTGVVAGPNGDYFMSQLTGFPFPVGAANVYRVDRKSGAQEVFASGFTNLMDLAFDRKGTLWVLEIDHDGLLGPGTDGAIFAVNGDGEKKRLSLSPGTLTHPGGITVGDGGALYVTNKAETAGEGEVLRIDVTAHDAEDDDDEHEGDRRERHHKKHDKGHHKRHDNHNDD